MSALILGWVLVLPATFAAGGFDGAVDATGGEVRAGEPDPTVALTLRHRTGVAAAAHTEAAFHRVESGVGQPHLSTLTATIALPAALTLAVRADFAVIGVELPGGSYRFTRVWGDPAVDVEHHHALTAADGWRLGLDVGGGLAIPIVPGDGLDGRGLALAAALDAGERPELFTPGALPITAAGRLVWRHDRGLDVALGVRLPLLVDVDDTPGAHAVGFAPAAELTVDGRLFGGLALGATARVVAPAPALVEPARDADVDAAQAVVAAHLGWQWATVGVGLDGALPIGGALAGTAALGLSLDLRL